MGILILYSVEIMCLSMVFLNISFPNAGGHGSPLIVVIHNIVGKLLSKSMFSSGSNLYFVSSCTLLVALAEDGCTNCTRIEYRRF